MRGYSCTLEVVIVNDDLAERIGEYFSSQFSHLNNADAGVCKFLHKSRQYYDTRMPFEEVVTRECIFSVRNPMISLG